MRYVDFATFVPSAAWVARSRAATTSLLALQTNDERQAYIKANAQIWRDLRNELVAHFGSRCWFTDAEESVAQLDTEHFRPKSEALDEDGTSHEGYWWLAFELTNLRLAGQIPNRQHKKCFFPLLAGSIRASSMNPRWQEELPVFLDPIRLTDVELVAYNETGGMCPSENAMTDVDRLRVEVTNKLLGLSVHPPLVEARQRVWSDCRNMIDEIEKLKAEERQFGVPTARTQGERERLMRQLHDKTRSKESFASIARCCLLMSGKPWARIVAIA